MTVSPNWPQDGNRPIQQVSSSADADEAIPSPALPPTLFKLPSLNPVPHATARIEESSAKTAETSEPVSLKMPPASEQTSKRDDETSSHVSEAVQDVKPQDVPGSEVSRDRHDDPPQNPPAVSAATTFQDRPAGRSWLETIGSHSVVIVLLLVVIAIALFTGRSKQEDSTLADKSDLLNFDQSVEVELPIPSHAHSSTELTVELPSPDNSDFQNENPSIDMGSPSGRDLVNVEGPDESGIGAEPDASQIAAANDQAAGESVSVDSDPQVSAIDVNRGRVDATRVQVNQFVSGPTNIEMMPASNRAVTEKVDSELPSLEDLADEPPAVNDDKSSVPAPVYSKTPLGIKDFSHYLPPVPTLPSGDVAGDNPSE